MFVKTYHLQQTFSLQIVFVEDVKKVDKSNIIFLQNDESCKLAWRLR